MNDCEKQIQAYIEDLKKDVVDVIDNALSIMKIVDISNNQTIGYIIVLAMGGPHIEINTRDNEICCCWWGDNAKRILDNDVVEKINDYLDQITY